MYVFQMFHCYRRAVLVERRSNGFATAYYLYILVLRRRYVIFIIYNYVYQYCGKITLSRLRIDIWYTEVLLTVLFNLKWYVRKCVVNRKWEVVLLLSFIIDDILKCCLPRTIPEWLNIGSSITIREWIFSRQFSSLEGGERAIAQGGKVKISNHEHCLFHIKEK